MMIFALIAGISILVLSIYAVSKVADTKSYESNTKIAKQISVFIDPLQAGFATSSKGEIDFNQKVKLKNICENNSDFGSNRLSIATLDIRKKEYSDFGSTIDVKDKYIFSKEVFECQKIFSISKKFSYPFEVSDFIILIPDSEEYCFENAPEDIKKDLSFMELPNLYFSNCKSNNSQIQVCGNAEDCNISIFGECNEWTCKSKYNYGIVKKNNKYFYYVDELLYPAIFSDYSNYNCNIYRLLKKSSILSDLYYQKSLNLNARGCATDVGSSIFNWKDKIDSIDELSKMLDFYPESNEININNMESACKLW